MGSGQAFLAGIWWGVWINGGLQWLHGVRPLRHVPLQLIMAASAMERGAESSPGGL